MAKDYLVLQSRPDWAFFSIVTVMRWGVRIHFLLWTGHPDLQMSLLLKEHYAIVAMSQIIWRVCRNCAPENANLLVNLTQRQDHSSGSEVRTVSRASSCNSRDNQQDCRILAITRTHQRQVRTESQPWWSFCGSCIQWVTILTSFKGMAKWGQGRLQHKSQHSNTTFSPVQRPPAG